MSLEDHIDITPPTMEREEYPEPSTTQVESTPGATAEEPLEGGSEDIQVEPTEEEVRQAKLKEKALQVGLCCGTSRETVCKREIRREFGVLSATSNDFLSKLPADL